jgi:predicted DNA-binding transcriptional regulator AlpA
MAKSKNDAERVIPPLPGYITEEVLADRTRRSKKTMWRMRKNGKGPVPTIIGRQVFYAESDVAAWLERCRQVKPPSRTRRMKSARRVSLGRTREGRAA